jgi:hypothetical protein
MQTTTVAKYLESLPDPNEIREQLARNERERKLLQNLLRLADRQSRLAAKSQQQGGAAR